MSFDNANPTVFQNTTGGGRLRFQSLRPPKEKVTEAAEADEDETVPNLKEFKEILNLKPATPYHEYLENGEKKGDGKVDYIDSQEIYSKDCVLFCLYPNLSHCGYFSTV